MTAVAAPPFSVSQAMLPTVAGIRAAIAPVLARLAAGVRQRDETRTYAYAEVRELAQAGLLLIGIPAEDGGAGGTLRDVLDVALEIARADSNVAQALRTSILRAHQIAFQPDTPDRAQVLEHIKRGDLFAGTSNERNGGASGSVSTTVTRDGDGYLLNGEKYYSTGGLYAQWFSSTALDDDGELVYVTVPTDRQGVELIDDFDAVGQRLTASGTTRLVNVRVNADESHRLADRTPSSNPWLGTIAQLYLAAAEAGIAAAALDDAVWFGNTKARPIKHSNADRSVDDPYVRRVVGEIGARAYAARAAVLLAAEDLDALRTIPGAELRAAAARAAVTVAQAQVVAAESALKAAELLFDVGGGTATNREFALDRHWRNARTIANHNPRDWKLGVAGAYHLIGEEPPTSGLF